MSFGTAVRVCFSKYADFSGRARRAEFWWFYLALNLLSIVLIGIPYVLMMIALFSASNDSSGNSNSADLPGLFWVGLALLALGSLASLATVIPMYAVMARRLHDTGQSGHWIWLSLAGAGIVPLVMCAMDGNAYPNQYGPDPKADERAGGGFVGAGSNPGQPIYGQPVYAQPGYPTPPAPPVYAQPGYPTPPAPPAPPAPPSYPGQSVPPAPPSPQA